MTLQLKISILLIFITYFTFLSCKSQSNLIIQSDAKNWFTRDTSIAFDYGWSAAYGYRFCIPKSFKEILSEELSEKNLESLEYADTSFYKSQDNKAILKFWTGESIFRDIMNGEAAFLASELRVKKEIDSTYQSIIGKKIISSDYQIQRILQKNETNKLIIEASNIDKTLIYIVFTAEIPVSGDYGYNYVWFEYPKKDKQKYESIAAEIIYVFGDLLRE